MDEDARGRQRERWSKASFPKERCEMSWRENGGGLVRVGGKQRQPAPATESVKSPVWG